jgi:hypothetical protein
MFSTAADNGVAAPNSIAVAAVTHPTPTTTFATNNSTVPTDAAAAGTMLEYKLPELVVKTALLALLGQTPHVRIIKVDKFTRPFKRTS